MGEHKASHTYLSDHMIEGANQKPSLPNNFGMRVEIKFKKPYPRTETFRNVTEIHYGFKPSFGQRIAFESDIHEKGYVYDIGDLEEFEVFSESEKAKFMEF